MTLFLYVKTNSTKNSWNCIDQRKLDHLLFLRVFNQGLIDDFFTVADIYSVWPESFTGCISLDIKTNKSLFSMYNWWRTFGSFSGDPVLISDYIMISESRTLFVYVLKRSTILNSGDLTLYVEVST